MPQSWESYIREEEKRHEDAAMGRKVCRCLSAILAEHSADSLSRLARNLYEYTDCGAALGVLLHRGEDNPGEWVYEDFDKIDMSREYVVALSVSSIVEGVERDTETQIVDLTAMRGPKTAVKAYGEAVARVEAEAKEIWNETHGCPTCSEHFGGVSANGIEECEGSDGMTSVWSECPDCGGLGDII